MITFSEISVVARLIFLFVFLIVEVANIALLVFSFLQPDAFKERKLVTVLLILQISVGYTMLISGCNVERMLANRTYGYVEPFLAKVPASVVIAILFVFVVYTSYRLAELTNWWQSHLSAFSIKHSMDALPEGLCYYDETGKTFIINNTMNEISLVLRGTSIRNAVDFYNDIKYARVVPKDSIVINEENLLVINAGNAVFSFRNSEIKDEFGTFYELKVADITEEYSKTQELHQKQKELHKQQEYLSRLGETIKQVTIKKEILSAKINVHDRLGENLIAARRYLATGEGDTEAISKLWFDNLTLLSNPQAEATENPLKAILAAADDIGINLIWEGEVDDKLLLSENSRISDSILSLLANATHECITNTMRHAKGDTIYIDVKSDFSIMSFRNNGDVPTKTVHESGGLLNIRKQASGIGYRMTIVSFPEFKLILKSNG